MLEMRKMADSLARRSMYDFLLATAAPNYVPGWVHEEICAKLDQFLQDVIDKKSPRLALFMPPRHGKTEVASRKFPAYALGRYPDLSIVATSYADSLASAVNRDVQRVIDSPDYARIFPGTKLNGSNVRTTSQESWLRNSDIFEIVGHRGVYKSAGRGTGITGLGGDIVIIDDPLKDAAEAYSETVREGLWEWYRSTFYTRMQPGAGVLLIQTRWHEDDLAGRLLAAMAANEGDTWEVINYPAVAEADEAHRKEGEALHEARYGVEALQRIRRAVGAKVWNALFQQRPSAAEGSILKRDHWKYFKWPYANDLRKNISALGITRIIIGADTALGGKKKNDYTAFAAMGVSRDRYYMLDLWKEKVEFPEGKRALAAFYDKFANLGVSCQVIIEGGGSHSGKATAQELRREGRIPINEVPNTTDKVARVDGITPLTEAGLVSLPDDAAWASDFVDNCAKFPAAKHDDDVDAFAFALSYAAYHGATGLLDYYRDLLTEEEQKNIERQMRQEAV